MHEVPATQPVPFVLHPVKKVLHSSSVKPFLSEQTLFLHLLVRVSHPHLPTPLLLVDAAKQIN